MLRSSPSVTPLLWHAVAGGWTHCKHCWANLPGCGEMLGAVSAASCDWICDWIPGIAPHLDVGARVPKNSIPILALRWSISRPRDP
jgi:hypothetical protein